MVDVHIAATSDCQKVFIASQMQQKVAWLELLQKIYLSLILLLTLTEMFSRYPNYLAKKSQFIP
jgi:hypothetical protein